MGCSVVNWKCLKQEEAVEPGQLYAAFILAMSSGLNSVDDPGGSPLSTLIMIGNDVLMAALNTYMKLLKALSCSID